jgi:hypothetical protein
MVVTATTLGRISNGLDPKSKMPQVALPSCSLNSLVFSSQYSSVTGIGSHECSRSGSLGLLL